MLVSIVPQVFRMVKLLTNQNCTFSLEVFQLLALQGGRTVITTEEDQCQQSSQLLDASHSMCDEAKSLDSGTRVDPALFLKIFLIYYSSRTCRWQLPGTVLHWGEADCGVRVQAGNAEEMTTYEGAVRFSAYQIFFPPLLSFFRMLGPLLRGLVSTAST